MNLSEFLLARIAEDEAVAREAVPSVTGWSVGLETSADRRSVVAHLIIPNDSIDSSGVASDEVARTRWLTSAAHIARWDPARVLAECEAKRRIVEIESRWRRTKDCVYASSGPGFDGLTVVNWHDDDQRPHEETVTTKEFRERFTEPSPPSEILRLVALPYADHPDYRESWRP